MLDYFYFKAPQPTNQVKNCEFKHKKQATILIVSLFLSETIQTASCVFVTFVLFPKTLIHAGMLCDFSGISYAPEQSQTLNRFPTRYHHPLSSV